MLKSDLIKALVARHEGLKYRDVDRILNAVLDEIGGALAAGNRVELRGFGTFTSRHRPARTARNPRDGTSIEVAAKNVPHFKPGRILLDRMNGDADS